MHARRSIAAATALLFAAGCGGTATQTIPAGGGQAARSAAPKRAKIEVRLKVPHRKRHEHYISPSTQSVAITEDGTVVGIINTAPSSPGCTASAGGRLCVGTFGVYSGTGRVFAAQAYDKTGGATGGGKLLSSGTLITSITAGQLNVIPLTMSGSVNSIAVAVQNPNSNAGTSATLRVSVMAEDVDGNTIVGPGTFVDASGAALTISLTDSDATGATQLSATTVSGPNDSVKLTYNGKSLTQAVIGATAPNVAPANVTAGTFHPTPVVVGDFQLSTAIGSNSPVALEPTTIVSGPDGNMWFAERSSGGTPGYGIVQMSTSGAMTTFVPGVAPSTSLPNEQFNGLAVGSDHNIWYAGASSVGNINPTTGAAVDYPFSGLGVCASPIGEAVAPAAAADGGLWFVISCSSGSSAQLLHMSTGGTPTVSALTGLSKATNLILGKDGNVYVTGTSSAYGAILQASVSNGSVQGTPAIVLASSGSLAAITGLYGIAQSADGDLWVSNSNCQPSAIGRLHLAAGFSAANFAAYPALSGCSYPAGIAALPDDSLWVADDDYPEGLQVIPSSNQGPPALFNLVLPSPPEVFGDEWEVALGPDGALYFVDDDYSSSPVASGDIVKVVY